MIPPPPPLFKTGTVCQRLGDMVEIYQNILTISLYLHLCFFTIFFFPLFINIILHGRNKITRHFTSTQSLQQIHSKIHYQYPNPMGRYIPTFLNVLNGEFWNFGIFCFVQIRSYAETNFKNLTLFKYACTKFTSYRSCILP